MYKPSMFLEADDNILEKNLKFVKNDIEDEIQQILTETNGQLDASNAPRDYIIVTPRAGFCIKSFKVNTNEKYFINVCQTEEIPAPQDISEDELTQILQSDVPGSYRIPMSISDPRITKDKSNKPVDVCDIAINPKFFTKLEQSLLFRDFFLALITEALSEKYNVQVKTDKAIILSNRKFIGTLVAHRVRNKDVKSVLKSYNKPGQIDFNPSKKPLVQEVNENDINEWKNRAIETRKSSEINRQDNVSSNSTSVPEFKLRAKLKGETVDEIQAEFYLPKCVSSQEIALDVGEDRIIIESMKHGYLFDKFVDYRLDQERVNAIFDKTNKMLQVKVPVFSI